MSNDFLKSIKEGDEVIVCSTSSGNRTTRKIKKVQRTTATRIIVPADTKQAAERFHRRNGEQMGESRSWRTTHKWLEQATEEAKTAVERAVLRDLLQIKLGNAITAVHGELGRLMGSYCLDRLSDDGLKELLSQVKAFSVELKNITAAKEVSRG